MSETTQIQPHGNGRLADDDVIAYLREIGREDLIANEKVAGLWLAEDAIRYEAVPDIREAVRAADAKTAEPARPLWWSWFRLPKISGASVTAVAFALLLLVVEAVIAAESWGGLAGFGRMIHITGRAAWGVPVTLDGVSLIAALIALRAELEGEASGRARATMFAFTAASAAANWWHGQHSGGTGAALYLGGMSLAVAWVFALILWQLRSKDRRRAKRVTDPLPKFGAAHWLRYPGLTFKAQSLAIRDGHTSPRAALDAAKAADLPPLPLDDQTLAGLPARDRLAVAFGAVGAIDVPKALALLEHHGCPIDQSHSYQIRRALLAGAES